MTLEELMAHIITEGFKELDKRVRVLEKKVNKMEKEKKPLKKKGAKK